jgi:formylglycine-generating enzyme required for sulfatase activity
MAGKIFINYRRGDDPGNTGRIFDRLREAFEPEQLFMDVDSIAPGLDFVRALEQQVGQCDALLAVIGPRWLEATDQQGNRRLDDANDFVRLEIESALKQGKLVIPVLVGEARMPRPDELPEAIRPLARHNAVRLTHERFRADAQGLVKSLQQALQDQRKARRSPQAALLVAGCVVGVGAVVAVAWMLAARPPIEQEPKVAEATQPPVVEPVPAPPIEPQPETSRVSDAPLSPERERALKPKDSFRECAGCPEMVVMSAGRFTMGSRETEEGRSGDESPQHAVTFARPFAVGRFAVTFEEWDACVADGGCAISKPLDQGWGRGRRPVIDVTWDDAKAYVSWLSNKTGKPYRLLSEAEREYVTRAGTTTPFWWGSSISSDQANYDGTFTYGGGAKGENRRRTVPVDSFQPNPWDLFQVHGNVREWLEDCYHDSYRGAPSDGTAWISGDCSRRAIRGGSWLFEPRRLRSASRDRNAPDRRFSGLGFRVARALAP